MTIQPAFDSYGYPTLSPAQGAHAQALLEKLTGIDWTCLSTDQIRDRFRTVLNYVVGLVAENLFDSETIELHDRIKEIYTTAYSCAYNLPAPTDSPDELPF